MYKLSDLVDYLVNSGYLRSKKIIKAFLTVDRANFVKNKNHAYNNIPLKIGEGQTISQPATVAFMIELLSPRADQTVLDIGSGSGWTTALLAQIIGKRGRAIGLEIRKNLVKIGQKNLAKYNFSWAKIQIAQKYALGIPGKTFDRILVSASSETLPEELKLQLKKNGILVMPIKNSIFRVKKFSKNKFKIEEFPGFIFVPLIW